MTPPTVHDAPTRNRVMAGAITSGAVHDPQVDLGTGNNNKINFVPVSPGMGQ